MIPEIYNRIADHVDDRATYQASGFTMRVNSTSLGKPNSAESSDRNILFQSKRMNETVRLAKRFAKSEAAVLIHGETGTGKELFSRMIHQQSRRSEQRFVAVNCAAVSESLFESELFGHAKGAFTGAATDRKGFFESANRGTLLLDEVSEIPVKIQAKLLRVLEEAEVQPVGSNTPRAIDVRVIATTNRDLSSEVAKGNFREDLFHRLNVLELNVAPLRERVSDIPMLVSHFLRRFRQEREDPVDQIDGEAMQLLCEYAWPGNVRELRNVLHRACVVANSTTICPEDLPDKIHCPQPVVDAHSFQGKTLALIERQIIVSTLQKYRGRKKDAAVELGVSPRTLSNKIKQYEAEGIQLNLQGGPAETFAS